MSIFKRSLRTTMLAAALLFFCFCSFAQKLTPLPHVDKKWSEPYDPFRIAGNLYYVGTSDLGCYLITTPEGHILINTGLAESVPVIRAHVETLGFKFSDIKILLVTHAHYDHAAGMAEIKKMTGAKMMINENDVPAMADGGNSDYLMGGKGSLFLPVKADRVLHDRDTVKLGGTNVIMLNHPGHTKGASSYLVDVRDEQRSYRVLIANMPSVIVNGRLQNMPSYPRIVEDYAYTFGAMKKLQFDLWVASHASQFNLDKKRKPGDGYHPEVFMDRAGYDKALNGYYEYYLDKLKENDNVQTLADLKNEIKKIIDTSKGHIGVAAMGLDFNDSIIINGNDRFPMQSVFKFPLAVYILHNVDRGQLSLSQIIHVPKNSLDVNTWSPLVKDFPKQDIDISLKDLLIYSVSKSDNNACDILFRVAGGTKPVNDYIHSIGIKNIAIVATEAQMKKSWEVQYTNWCQPTAMLKLLRDFYNDKTLSKSSNELLMKMMVESTNSPNRIKGLLPASTVVAHKTGTSNTNEKGITAAINDVGIVTLPDGRHFAIVVYVSGYPGGVARGEHIIALVTRLVWDYMNGK